MDGFFGAAGIQLPEVEDVRVGLIGIADEIPIHFAAKAGYFKEEGLTVTKTVVSGGAAGQKALLAGKVDILHASFVSVLLAKAQGFDLLIVANNSVAHALPPDGAQLIVKKDSQIRSPNDLERKRVGVDSLNNMNWLAVRLWAEKFGADPAKIIFQEVPFPEMLDALFNDRVDAIAAMEPFSTIAGGMSNTRVLGYYCTDLHPSLAVAGMVAAEGWVNKHPLTTRAFVRAYRRGIEQLLRSPTDTQIALIEFANMKPELAAKVQLNVPTTKSNPQSIQVWEELMLKSGLLKQKVGAAKLLYRTALK